ncbi:unnamed protein product [Rhodiola kirilowii]
MKWHNVTSSYISCFIYIAYGKQDKRFARCWWQYWHDSSLTVLSSSSNRN